MPVTMLVQPFNTPRVTLRVSGTKIVEENDKEIYSSRGAGMNGMLNMEHFITGYTGHEHEHRATMTEVLGKENADSFFTCLIHHFFTEYNAVLYASLGPNCVWVPFNYRHFMDIDNTSVIKKSGYEPLDRIVHIYAKQNIYAILDLHVILDSRNQGWNCNSDISREALACHYVGNKVVARYNPLNEPADPENIRLIACLLRKEEFMQKAGVPVSNSKQGLIYRDSRTDLNAAATNEKRFALLKEQLAIYCEIGGGGGSGGISWSIWLYNDIGYQGMVYLDLEIACIRLVRPFVEKQRRRRRLVRALQRGAQGSGAGVPAGEQGFVFLGAGV
ncbi:glucan 1,3-beta-glucosidase [Colletotrichum graminicola]|nr:glucan 1,3-beta-glucosidase [Colletotrichum graminicola]